MSESRRELLDGSVRMIPVSETKHQLVSLKIASALLLHVETRNLGHVLQAPCDVIFPGRFVIQPDIMFIEKRRSGLIEEKHLRGVPDVIIEIVSQNTRANDLTIKRKIYSRFAVKEYWTVDLHRETIEVLVWSELGYATAGVYGKSACLSSPALPGFKLSVHRVFHKQV